LRSVSTSGNAETDVHAGERGGEGGGRRGEGREEDDGLVELGTEDGSAEEGEGNTVDLDESLSFLFSQYHTHIVQYSSSASVTSFINKCQERGGRDSINRVSHYRYLLLSHVKKLSLTLAKATAVAVFFLPKVWTD